MQGPTHITIQLFVVPNLSSSLAVSLSRWSEGFRDRAIYLQKSAATLLYCGRLHGSSITFFCSEGLNWSRLGLHLHLLWLEGSLSSYTFIWVRCNERLFLLLSSIRSDESSCCRPHGSWPADALTTLTFKSVFESFSTVEQSLWSALNDCLPFNKL